MKKIMTKPNIQKSMIKYDHIYQKDPTRLKSIKDNTLRTFVCGNPKYGFFEFFCPSCGHSEKFPLSCKSRLCNRCGKIYAEKWATKLSNELLNVPHKHFILVHRFGIYSRRLSEKTQELLKKFKSKLFKVSFPT